MAKIVTVEQMINIEKAADASGLSYDQMMESAGQAVAEAMLAAEAEAEKWHTLVLKIARGCPDPQKEAQAALFSAGIELE